MLLVHQAGSVKVGEAVRYTVTYTPSADRILPSPSHLYVKIKNTSPIPLRAAYLHGPYSLYVSAVPSTFNPHTKVEEPEKNGVPEFEPFLKAGAHWACKLLVPEELRESGVTYPGSPARNSMESTASGGRVKRSITWIIEVVSQVIFSSSAAVHYEVMVSRDERSLELGFAAVAAQGHGAPGQLEDFKTTANKRDSRGARGIYSKAIKLTVEDTEALWNKPKLPGPQDVDEVKSKAPKDGDEEDRRRKKQKVHLVVLTHGLHSNLNADMLFLKESIDATVAQAKKDARERRSKNKATASSKDSQPRTDSTDTSGGKQRGDEPTATAPISGGQEDVDIDEEEEMVIVRGFPGNAIKTERGIQYLGKRLAKFVLKSTYPSQPYLPIKKKTTVRSLSMKLTGGSSDKAATEALPPSHHGSSVHRDDLYHTNNRAYQFTSISFVGHSLGGLTQLYAIAYIQKHAPDFFNIIKPINFVCMASPLLGLSNENPLYVKFALDFGLVGRTGQDLGLTWRAPTLAKSGWSAVGGVFGGNKEHKDQDPGAKPLLRVLPTGPAHQVLHMFRNRTVYSNVVNDGIVPLRTSCLLFLDWKGLGKVSKYRRENGLIGTMAEWGWAELTGANAERDVSVSRHSADPDPDPDQQSGSVSPMKDDHDEEVPQPSESATEDDNQASGALAPDIAQFLQPRSHNGASAEHGQISSSGATSSMLDDFLNFFRPSTSPKIGDSSSQQRSASSSSKHEHQKKKPKALKAIRRAQTVRVDEDEDENEEDDVSTDDHTKRPELSRGTTDNPTMRPSRLKPRLGRSNSAGHTDDELSAPPKTSFFESASDLLHPPIPSLQFLIDPESRPRTIFHDRVYHPADIPPAPVRQPSRLVRSFSSDKTSTKTSGSTTPTLKHHSSNSSLRSETGGMKVEEKIARAYHRDLSWRKVLVKLEPDAHNNMVVRRMFANAYGWPVVKHLCDTHFSDSWSARTRDEQETNIDRAASNVNSASTSSPGSQQKNTHESEEVAGQTSRHPLHHPDGDLRERRDELGSLDRSTADINALEARHRNEPDASGADGEEDFFSCSDDDSDDNNNDDSPYGAIEGSNKRTLSPAPTNLPASRKQTQKNRSPQRQVLHDASLSSKKHRIPSLNGPDIILDPADAEHFTTEPEDIDGESGAAKDQPQTPGTATEVGLGGRVERAMEGEGQADEEGHKPRGILGKVADKFGGSSSEDRAG